MKTARSCGVSVSMSTSIAIDTESFELDAVSRVGCASGNERFGQPRADVGLATHPGRAQTRRWRAASSRWSPMRRGYVGSSPSAAARVIRSNASWTTSSASATLPSIR